MGTGWRRAFCTTAPRNSDAAAPDLDKQYTGYTPSTGPSPRSCVKLAFLSGGSNPTTPKTSSTPLLRCRTADDEKETPELLRCKIETPKSAKTRKSPRPALTTSSNPSSPRSPLKLSLFRNSFKLRSSCGICLNSVKTGQGTAKYTAECSHAFHFPCIAEYVSKQGKLICPVCNSVWKDASLLAPYRSFGSDAVSVNSVSTPEIQENHLVVEKVTPRTNQSDYSRSYQDDEPLLSPRFIPIPEDDESIGGEDDAVTEFKGFVVNPSSSFVVKSREISVKGRDSGNVQVSMLPESAVVSVGCGYETHAVALRVKAPPPLAARGGGRSTPAGVLDPSQRAPVDLVAVVDVSGNMNGAKLHMVKRAMRLVISSLGSADRLSVIVVSTSPKRLLPLKRMTDQGKNAAILVVDRLLCGQGSNISLALKKATRVLEDRRERNPVASIILLSDGQSSRFNTLSADQRSTTTNLGSTRFSHIEIPITEYGFGESGGYSHAPAEEVFAKCVGGLLSVVVQDLRVQLRVGSGSGPCEISAVYLCNGRPTLVSSGSGSVRLGDLYAGEEREILVELRVPLTAGVDHHVLSVRGLYKDPSTQEVVYGRDQSLRVPQAVRSSFPRIERLRSLFIATRAVAESRRLVEYGECTSAHHLLTSARALLGQSVLAEVAEYVKAVEAELVEVQWRRQQLMEYQNQRRRGRERNIMMLTDENGEPLTPASAWRTAEKLAKVALTKKALSSDLHGFENARF